MVVDMPYGQVEINTPNDAIQFVRHHCEDCYMKGLMGCSYATSSQCDEMIRRVMARFSKVMVDHHQQSVTYQTA